jgi:hypothetical protein
MRHGDVTPLPTDSMGAVQRELEGAAPDSTHDHRRPQLRGFRYAPQIVSDVVVCITMGYSRVQRNRVPRGDSRHLVQRMACEYGGGGHRANIIGGRWAPTKTGLQTPRVPHEAFAVAFPKALLLNGQATAFVRLPRSLLAESPGRFTACAPVAEP